MAQIEMVRIYLTEHEGVLDDILRCLHDEHRVRGVTVFRGISGFGASGRMHEARWTDLSLDLPVVVEFFDTPERTAEARAALEQWVASGHMVHWPATVNEPTDKER